MKYLLTCFYLLLFVFTIKAQNPGQEICGYKHEVEKILKKQPNFLVWQDAIFKQAFELYNEEMSAKRRIVPDTQYYEIPVVFHVLYNNSNENLNISYINVQIHELNLAFRKLTSDTQRIRAVFKQLAADVRIQFVLATIDPNGNPTTGVTRTPTSKTTFATSIYGEYGTDMKYSSKGGKDAWNPTRYLNIWSCNMRYPNQVSMTLGFATPPTGAPNWFGGVTKDSTDVESGVVLHFSVIGRNNPLAINNSKEGKTGIHEVGHYFGLRHVWGDGDPNNGCNVDDGIFDTPNARDKNYSCSSSNPPNSCIDAVNDLPDQTENYMDYALDGCAAMFTREQAYLMRYVLNNFRTGLPTRKITFDTLADQTTIEMFPNPATEQQKVRLQISTAQKSNFKVLVIDMNGKQVLTQNIVSNAVQNLDVSALARSVYYVIIMDADNRIVDRKPLLIH